MKSYALHIGLNKVDPVHYDNWSGILYGCENDAKVYESISKQWNLDKIYLLLSEDATSAHIFEHFQKAAQTLKAGDLFFVTYAGHGGYLADLNGDEPDGRDETWCAYDRQVIDDELFEAFSKFNGGVKILMFSDSCHSGTMARRIPATMLGREIDKVLKRNNVIERLPPADVLARTFRKNEAEYREILERPAVNPEDIPSYVLLFAACQDNETAKEQGDNGIFTATVQNVCNNGFTGTYNEFFEKIRKGIDAAVQVPNLFFYGNEQFDFQGDMINLKETSNPVIVPRPLERPEIIIHKKDRGIDLKTTPKQRSAREQMGNDWDEAYDTYLSQKVNVDFVEPNIGSQYIKVNRTTSRGGGNDYLSNWPNPKTGPDEFIWHLDEDHSQLKQACNEVLAKKPDAKIKIGHIDVGYRDHVSKPKNLLDGISFVNGENTNKGKDITVGSATEIDGHGCGTLAILAGNMIEAADSYAGYKGEFGGIPFADVVPIRICDTVYNLFNANDVARGINYAVENQCKVITMSMAGYPTKRVARAVNEAYEAGVFVVTAAGNNWTKGIQRISPKAVLYPARFDRVIAATGACYNHRPYDLEANEYYTRSGDEALNWMQGNWGPSGVMETALAAYTPNLAWACFSNIPATFRKSGGGTSSATPQIAAAAALWLAFHEEELIAHGYEGWQKVEAVRQALFRSASKEYKAYKTYFGKGILRAFDALTAFDVATEKGSLVKSPEAKVKFFGLAGFVSQWFKKRGSPQAIENDADENLTDMMSLEIVQVMHSDEKLMPYLDSTDIDSDGGWEFLEDKNENRKFLDLLRNSPYSSNRLKASIPND